MNEGRTEQRRRQIMDAVVDVTVAGGMQAVTFRTVAEQAGVSVRLLQYYFGDKARLLSDTLTHVQLDIAEIVATSTASLGDRASARRVLEAICRALLPLDERRRRAMLVFLVFGTAALTDEALQGPEGLRRGQGLADVLAEHVRRVRSDGDVADDVLLLVMTISGLGNGLLAGDLTVDQARRLSDRALDLVLGIGND